MSDELSKCLMIISSGYFSSVSILLTIILIMLCSSFVYYSLSP